MLFRSDVSNTGSLAGAEVVQLYVSADKTTSSIPRPVKELKGFTKVYLQPGETKRVEIPFDRFTFAFWDQELHAWVNEKGTYIILVGTSSQKFHLQCMLEVKHRTVESGI